MTCPKGMLLRDCPPVSWRSGICERLAQRLLSHGYIFSYPIPMTFKCYLKQAGVSKTAQRSLPRQIALRFSSSGFAPLRCVATPLCKTSTALAALQHRSAQDDTRDGARREQAPALRIGVANSNTKRGKRPFLIYFTRPFRPRNMPYCLQERLPCHLAQNRDRPRQQWVLQGQIPFPHRYY